ncbi:MAG TPA: CoA-binding protein [Candidatus Acidoferrum sp.]|nr:CoA-binding protein [Candidatus Acidoferrum sp.]
MNDTIQFISTQSKLAVVGVSDKKFGGEIYKTLKRHGYTVYGVHPTRKTFAGDTCYGSLKEVQVDVKAAVIVVSPKFAEPIVDDAIAAEMTHLWFQLGNDYSSLVRKAQENGIKTVSRKCILMYAQPVSGIHKFHRGLAKFFGRF